MTAANRESQGNQGIGGAGKESKEAFPALQSQTQVTQLGWRYGGKSQYKASCKETQQMAFATYHFKW